LKLFQKSRLLAAPEEDEPMYKGMKAERILGFYGGIETLAASAKSQQCSRSAQADNIEGGSPA
jgi:hypothetical protein